jgi:hypothetical protein
MTSVGQAATTELMTAAAAPTSGWIPRALGLAAVALAPARSFFWFWS